MAQIHSHRLHKPLINLASFRHPQRHAPRHAPRKCTARAGLLDFLNPIGAGGKEKSAELVEELLNSSSLSLAPSAQAKEEVKNLIDQLRKFRPRNPTRSKHFWGEYEVLFSTKPNATGGPVLGSLPGRIIFGGQKPRQTIQRPGKLIQSVQFKALGVVPGKLSQEGRLSVVDGNQYEVYLDVRGEEVTRRFEVLYLDERVRIAEFLSDSEPEPVIFIFKRAQET